MALKLLHERRLGAASRLGPYVAALPQGFATPLGWSAAQLDALRYPRLQQQVCLQLCKSSFPHSSQDTSVSPACAARTPCCACELVLHACKAL